MIRIDFSEHNYQALLTIQAKGNNYPTLEEILAEIESHTITFGLDSELIEQIAKQKEPIRKVVIATGQSAVYGKDAVLDWKILHKNEKTNQVSGNNRVDFKRAHIFEGVKANQTLVLKKNAELGEDGRSVQNEVISSLGKDADLPIGRNTHLSNDVLSIIADIDGSAFIEGNQLNIDKVFLVKGNVSYATGNIKFDGPVVIEGDVLSGFRVEARDSIHVGGNVEAASVYSHTGDITVNYGILGKGRAKVLAGGSLKCGFIQDATVGVRKDVKVDRYISNSTITAGGKVTLTENEGLIRGGSVEAEMGITAKEVGSERHVSTELHIRNQGENESQNTLWDLSRSRSELTVRLSSLSKRKAFLSVLESRLGVLSADKLVELEFISGEITRIRSRIDELNAEELELQKSASKIRITREIIVAGITHKNVSIDISGLGFHCVTPMSGVKFFRFKNEILIESILDMENEEYDIFIPKPDSD